MDLKLGINQNSLKWLINCSYWLAADKVKVVRNSKHFEALPQINESKFSKIVIFVEQAL